MDALIKKITDKMLSSKGYSKSEEPRQHSTAACTVHHFDNIYIRQAHNGQESYAVYFSGDLVGRIPRDDFYATMDVRKNQALKSFMES